MTARVIFPLAALCLLLPAVAIAAPAVPEGPLPVRAVSLFSSGVAYTERGGFVDGNADIPLSFPTAQINDLLKSLVLLDDGGQVQPVTYGARDSVAHALQSFAVDITQNISRADLLQKLRGARVSITLAPGQPMITGQIVSVETRTEHRPDGTVTDSIASLNLLTAAGLVSVDLKDARAITLLDPRLDAEFRQALAVLATGTDDTRRPVTLHFAGTGRRNVTVGYVTEAPLWKISYRLLLGKTPYLQGWALVENTTDDDWNAIHLSLVSGRPVSFIEDLYQPLYLPRPVVAPDIIASPYPQTHGANMNADENGVVNAPAAAPMAAPMTASTPSESMTVNGALLSKRSAGSVSTRVVGGAFYAENASRFGVQSQANGQQAGEQYAYDIKLPVSLPRQQSAMIPVVAQNITGNKVLLYNADTDPRYPLNAVRLENTTGLHLKGGPVTLFDDGVYAGDARMEDINIGETRLISYAVDLSVTGERQTPQPHSATATLSIRRGVLIVTRRETQETRYAFKSHASGPRTVLVEHPYDAGQKLIAPDKADERTPQFYRFAVPVLPGKAAALTVITERPISTEYGLFDTDFTTLAAFSTGKDISPATRNALESIIQRRRAIDELRTAAQNRAARVASFTADQERIRKNMQALDKSSALYKRYSSELDAQETNIQRLRAEADALNAKASALEAALRADLDSLTL